MAEPAPRPAGCPLTDRLAQERTGLAAERTLMAAERTLLAYVRTALALVAGGLMLVHSFDSAASDAVGLALLPVGALTLDRGVGRFARLRRLVRTALR